MLVYRQVMISIAFDFVLLALSPTVCHSFCSINFPPQYKKVGFVLKLTRVTVRKFNHRSAFLSLMSLHSAVFDFFSIHKKET
jgi:hypothetical protein